VNVMMILMIGRMGGNEDAKHLFPYTHTYMRTNERTIDTEREREKDFLVELTGPL